MSAINFLAGLGVGYLREDEKKSERAKEDAREARRNKREDTADARATEVYNAGKAERERMAADRDTIRTAAQPVPITPEATMPAAMDARDIGQPGEAPVPVTGYKVGAARFASQGLAEAEATRQRDVRVASAMDTVDPAGAQGRRTQALQGQVAQLQLTAAQQAAVQKQWGEKRAAAVNAAIMGQPEKLAQFMTESQADGLDGKSKWVHRIEGKELVLQPVDGAGKPINNGFRIGNDPAELTRWGVMLDERTPLTEKLKDIRETQRYTDQRTDRTEDNERQRLRDAANEQYQQGMLRNTAEANAARLEIAILRAAASARGGQPGQASVWDEKADAFLRERYTVKDPNTGAISVDGEGMRFGKALALGMAQNNGGNTTDALGYAFDRDNKLRAAATDAKGAYDSKLHGKLRADFMSAAMGNGQAPAPAPAPAAPSAPPRKAADMASAGVPPPQAMPPQVRNPFVDASGKALPQTVDGGGSLLSTTVVPAVKNAATSVDRGLSAGVVTYLKAKIARGEPLTRTEQMQAQRAGL